MAVVSKRPASLLLRPMKRAKPETGKGIQGLQKVLGPNARPKSQGQAEALELVYTATAIHPQIIVLSTGSGKSLLFFSVAAMVTH